MGVGRTDAPPRPASLTRAHDRTQRDERLHGRRQLDGQLDGHPGNASRRDELSRRSAGNCRGSRAPHRVGCAHWGARRKATPMTIDASDIDVRRLPVVIDLPTAARLLGIGRTSAYELVRTGQWPTPVIRAGRLIRVPTRPLLVLLCLAEQP